MRTRKQIEADWPERDIEIDSKGDIVPGEAQKDRLTLEVLLDIRDALAQRVFVYDPDTVTKEEIQRIAEAKDGELVPVENAKVWTRPTAFEQAEHIRKQRAEIEAVREL